MKRHRKKMICFLLFTVFLLLHIIYGMEADGGVAVPKLFPVTVWLRGESTKEPVRSMTEQRKTMDDGKISVLIKTQGFSGLYHKTIQITSAASFVVWKDGKEKTYHAGEKVRFSASELFSEYKERKQAKRLIKISTVGKGKLQLFSFKRAGCHPQYRGILWIRVEKDGLLLVNELRLGEYLYAVVSSEISSSASLEALKAQAVCARTYAANRRRASEYEKYGADLDDSDTCQVYNNFPETARTRKAVRETAGQVLKKDGKKIPVYYFAASWGYTASGKEVWNTDEEIPYLKRKFQITENCVKKNGKLEEPDLSEESAFRMFLEQKKYQESTSGKRYSFETYDSKSPWYRWNIEILWEELEQRIGQKIAACYDAYPNLVLFRKRGSDCFEKGSFCEPGELKKIYTGKRDSSGLVTELIIEGSRCAIKIKTQYSIRRLLSFPDEKIVLMDGSIRSAFTLLPSAAFYLEKSERQGKRYLMVKGGGFGHGTGMSQYGAQVQADLGWGYEKILQHYFTGVSIETEGYYS